MRGGNAAQLQQVGNRGAIGWQFKRAGSHNILIGLIALFHAVTIPGRHLHVKQCDKEVGHLGGKG